MFKTGDIVWDSKYKLNAEIIRHVHEEYFIQYSGGGFRYAPKEDLCLSTTGDNHKFELRKHGNLIWI